MIHGWISFVEDASGLDGAVQGAGLTLGTTGVRAVPGVSPARSASPSRSDTRDGAVHAGRGDGGFGRAATLALPAFAANAGRSPAGRGAALTEDEAWSVLRPIVGRSGDGRGQLRSGGHAANVRVVARFEDLPPAIQQAAHDQGSDGRDIQGVWHDGTIFIVAGNHSSAIEVERTLFHEFYGHFGLDALWGAAKAQQLRALFAGLGGVGGIRALAARHGIDLGAYERGILDDPTLSEAQKEAALTEELLAHLAERGPPGLRGMVQAIIGAIRAWLRDHGFARLSQLGDTDIAHILRQARRAAVEGGSPAAAASGPMFARVRRPRDVPPVPDGGLRGHEGGPGRGHLIKNHVERGEKWLRERIVRDGIKTASSFYDRATAAAAVAEVLHGNRAEIAAWLASLPYSTVPRFNIKKAFTLSLNRPVGVSIRRAKRARHVSFVRVVLMPHPGFSQGYQILTGYPTDELQDHGVQ